MSGLCPKGELSRSEKAAPVIATGPAPGIALVVTAGPVPAGMTQAQDKVQKSLYGLGTDTTVTEARPAPRGGRSAGAGPGAPTPGRAPKTAPAAGYACPVSNREIRPSSPTVKVHLVRISPQVSLR
ncbi:hypothetical protein [Streptomyces sp. NPDC004014]